MRRGMYLISPNHCIYEIVDNAVDEFSAGRCTKITITVNNDTVTVSDNGGGIPVTPSKDPQYAGKSQAEVALSVLHAGGKFGESSDGGYKTSTTGLNGVGASCVNAVSSLFVVNIRPNTDPDNLYALTFKKGIIQGPMEITDVSEDINFYTGTSITFELDPEVWNDEQYDFTEVKDRLKQLAYLNPGLAIVFNHYVDGKLNQHTYYSPKGLLGYINEVTANKEIIGQPLCKEITKTYDNNKDISIVVALAYVNGYSNDIRGFVNNVHTQYGGDHETGFKTGLLSIIRKYALEQKLIKDNKDIESSDILEGLRAIISIKLKDPIFEGQGKGKLRMNAVRSIVKSYIEEIVYDYFLQDTNRANTIIQKVLSAAKARDAAQRARNTAREVKHITSSIGAIQNFADCSSKNPEECEIFLVEGDSAGGSAKQARDRKYQAILPVFGKILNAEKATTDKIVGSSKLADLIKVLRTGIGEKFDLSKLRYHKVVLMSDADSDGGHIQCLHMVNQFRMMRPLVEAGHLYAACPPLYKVTKKSGKKEDITYLYNDDELNDYYEQNGRENISIQRYKG